MLLSSFWSFYCVVEMTDSGSRYICETTLNEEV